MSVTLPGNRRRARRRCQQGCILQNCVAAGAGPTQFEGDTGVPPPSTHWTVRDWVPPPHVAEQVENGPVNHEYVAHDCVLQAWVVGGAGSVQRIEETGVLRLSTQVTVRVCVPPPHSAEHVE